MKPLGKIRRSQVLTGNGPGAIIDFRGENGAPLSVVAAGLEAWDQLAIKKGLLNDQRIHHEPLQAKLQVNGFRLPPIGDEKARKESDHASCLLIGFRTGMSVRSATSCNVADSGVLRSGSLSCGAPPVVQGEASASGRSMRYRFASS